MFKKTWYFNDKPLSFLIITLLLSFCISGCGASGESAGKNGLTGKVALLLTDAPSDSFSKIYVTVKEAKLITEEEDGVILFQGSRRVDLLTLQEVEELFMLQENVPAGNYKKIRLLIESPEFVKKDGTVILTEQIHLVANGKIDLLAKGGFEVSPGKLLIVRIDLDAKESIHIHEAGKFKYQFRPVVFIKILQEMKDRLLSTGGIIESIDIEKKSFMLRRRMHDFSHVKDGDKNEGEDHLLNSFLIEVFVSDETIIVNDAGDSLAFDALLLNQKVHLRASLLEGEQLSLEAKRIVLLDPIPLSASEKSEIPSI